MSEHQDRRRRQFNKVANAYVTGHGRLLPTLTGKPDVSRAKDEKSNAPA